MCNSFLPLCGRLVAMIFGIGSPTRWAAGVALFTRSLYRKIYTNAIGNYTEVTQKLAGARCENAQYAPLFFVSYAQRGIVGRKLHEGYFSTIKSRNYPQTVDNTVESMRILLVFIDKSRHFHPVCANDRVRGCGKLPQSSKVENFSTCVK